MYVALYLQFMNEIVQIRQHARTGDNRMSNFELFLRKMFVPQKIEALYDRLECFHPQEYHAFQKQFEGLAKESTSTASRCSQECSYSSCPVQAVHCPQYHRFLGLIREQSTLNQLGSTLHRKVLCQYRLHLLDIRMEL